MQHSCAGLLCADTETNITLRQDVYLWLQMLQTLISLSRQPTCFMSITKLTCKIIIVLCEWKPCMCLNMTWSQKNYKTCWTLIGMSYASWLELHLQFASILLCVFALHWCSYCVQRENPKPLCKKLGTLSNSSAIEEQTEDGLYNLAHEKRLVRPSQRTLISPAQARDGMRQRSSSSLFYCGTTIQLAGSRVKQQKRG